MALYYDLKVFQDVYQLILKVFEFTKDFPREYKFTLGQDMKRDAIVLVRSIYRANKAKNKTEYLEQFLDDFEILKLEIRLCVYPSDELHLVKCNFIIYPSNQIFGNYSIPSFIA